MHDRRAFFLAKCPYQINDIVVAVMSKLASGEVMGPAEVHAADARPVSGDIAVFAGNPVLRNRKDAPKRPAAAAPVRVRTS